MEKTIKIIIAVLLLGGIYFLFETFSQSSEDKQEEAYAYVMTINALNQKQQKLVSDYTEQVVGAVDAEKGYTYLETTLIPAYQAYQEEVQMIKPLNEDLEAIYVIYKEAVKQQLSIYEEYNRAYKEQETTVYEKTNELLEANNKQFADHEEQLKLLAKEYNIMLKTK